LEQLLDNKILLGKIEGSEEAKEKVEKFKPMVSSYKLRASKDPITLAQLNASKIQQP
jgi:hypothetical protein